MEWTKTTPTEPGWYWHRNLEGEPFDSYSEERIVELYCHCDDGILIAFPDDGIEVEDPDNEWAGPIVKPFERAITDPEHNPPAFPTKREALDPRSTGWSMEDGMNLRDYFAAKAMQSYITHVSQRSEYSLSSSYREVAEESFRIADAMLAARKEGV